MGFLDNLLGGTQQRQDYQDFVNRYDQGAPHEGYSDQEVMQRYQQVAPNVPNDVYMQAAQEAFSRLTPEQRMQFGQQLQQRAGQQNLNYPDLNRPASDERFQDPGFLAQQVTRMHQQQPGLLGQLFGGGGGSNYGGSGAGGYGSSNAPEKDLLGNPVAKAALAGIAAMALKHMMGQQGQ